MSFQAGVFYFDRRPIQPGESNAILDSLAVPDYGRPTSWTAPGVFLAYAEFPSADRVARQPFATSGACSQQAARVAPASSSSGRSTAQRSNA